MKMSEKTLLKKIEQAFAENYCTGSYKIDILQEYEDETYYVLYYTYKTGETIAVNIESSWLGQVKFYSHVHSYYISNFNNHIKSVINVLRMLFDMIDSNKDIMIKYNEIETEEPEEPEEPEETEETVKDVMEVKQYFDRDSVQSNKTIIAKIEDINYCPNQNTCCAVSPYVHCDYKYKSDACIKAHKNFIHYCEQVHNHIKAIHNPEWHNVSLAKLANIDFDMLDEKHKLVRDINQILKDGIRNLYKCENHIAYEALERYVLRKCDELIRHNHLKPFWFSYIAQQLDEVRRNTIYLYAPYITAHRNIW